MNLFVTGGAGFIGSNFIRHILTHRGDISVTNLDKLTYAGNTENLQDLANHPNYRFIRGDICDAALLDELLVQRFDVIVNFAAETHVDRSIEHAHPFVRTNAVGTHTLLEAARTYRLPLFVQISTDEVYGSAQPGESFSEAAPLNPGSPYAASKAAADLFVLSYVNTYRLPAIIVRCTNNYGPYQFPEKMIPLMVSNAMENKPLPVYGDGLHERDWLYVEDYARAIEVVLERGRPAEIYNISSSSPLPNIRVVQTILRVLGKSDELIQFVEDRPGHDRRYSLDSTKVREALGWAPMVSFEEGIRRTIAWYQANTTWLERTRSGEYRRYYERHYARRSEMLKGIRE